VRFLGLSSRTWGAITVALVVALLAPLFLLNRFYTFEFGYVWLFTIAIIGLNILTGYSGQISLGNGAFMAVGGYTTAILYFKLKIPYGWTILPAGLLAGLAGYLFGFPALKLSGLYLALATFALALSAPPVIKNFGQLTGGHEGILMPTPTDPTGVGLTSEQWLYYLTLGIAVVMFVFSRALLAGQTGRAFRAIRDSETAAAASGISLPYYKTLAFGISAFYAGIAGSLFATLNAYVNPDSFDLPLSLGLLVGAVVGGLGTLAGPLVGALFAVWVPLYAQRIFHAKPDIAYGVILILLMFALPQGVVGGAQQLIARYRRRPRPELGEALDAADERAGGGPKFGVDSAASDVQDGAEDRKGKSRARQEEEVTR
jgi:branched-chain amino acid transport system permease protein